MAKLHYNTIDPTVSQCQRVGLLDFLLAAVLLPFVTTVLLRTIPFFLLDTYDKTCNKFQWQN